MVDFIQRRLDEVRERGNLRRVPAYDRTLIDLSSNDYLGIGGNVGLREKFIDSVDYPKYGFTSSASRLLAASQSAYNKLELTLEKAYGRGRKALIFNSGYHANVGIISAFGKDVFILADKLVHASIIDGIKLGAGGFARFAHNDMDALEKLIMKYQVLDKILMIVVESVYSMDGDGVDMEALMDLKRRYPGILVYVDEAHAVGVEGPGGLGYAFGYDADIIVGTFGKALGGMGAYVVTRTEIREYLVNFARSFIFSTALPPVNVLWDEYVFNKALEMDSERQHLKTLGVKMQSVLKSSHSGHIQPWVIGDAEKTLNVSVQLAEEGFSAMAIRTPTVPVGTERIRFSLSSALQVKDIENLGLALRKITVNE